MVSELFFPEFQMANPNNQEPLSMEDRVCKLEAQVGELGIKIDTQFHATVEKLRVKVSNFRDEMFNFRNEILEALGLDSSAYPLMNPVQRVSTVQTPSMAPQPYQLSPPLVQLEVGRSDRSAPLVSAEESGYLVGGSEAVKIAGDSELLMTNQEVEVCEGVVPCLVDNGMLKDSRISLDNLEELSDIKEEIAVEVTDKNENLLAPVNRVGINDEHDMDNDDGFSNSVEQMEKSVRKMVGKTPNDYVNPDEVFALEAVIQDGVLMGNESDIVLLNVTLLSIALKTRGGSNVGGAGINIDFAFLIRIVLTTMRLVLQVEVELDVFYGNPIMQGCSEFPFDLGGILPCQGELVKFSWPSHALLMNNYSAITITTNQHLVIISITTLKRYMRESRYESEAGDNGVKELESSSEPLELYTRESRYESEAGDNGGEELESSSEPLGWEWKNGEERIFV
nr:heat shock 70 kDa protein 6, chloroplastic-like [Ipomoea batatas]